MKTLAKLIKFLDLLKIENEKKLACQQYSAASCMVSSHNHLYKFISTKSPVDSIISNIERLLT